MKSRMDHLVTPISNRKLAAIGVIGAALLGGACTNFTFVEHGQDASTGSGGQGTSSAKPAIDDDASGGNDPNSETTSTVATCSN